MALAVAPAPPLLLGKYQLLRRLGAGGMGAVHLGRCQATGAQVVVKQLHRDLAEQPVARAQFQRELDVLKQFRHPFAVGLLEGGWSGSAPCLILEYVDGVTLEEFAKSAGPIEPHRLGRWLGQLCQVLHAAHGAGILHRDLSLANLMLVDAGAASEHIKVMDFGLARRHGGVYIPLEKLAGAASAVGGGTPDYACPEQIRGESVDARGDLYSVGVILFRLLTGKLPFEHAQSVSAILQAHVHTPPPRFARIGAGHIPLPLEAVVHLCLAKDPAERPQTARELAELYGEALGEPIAPPEAFAEVAPLPAAPAPAAEPRAVLDRVQAWMPEQIAVMKLRGFVSSMGGEVVDSQPGLLRMRLRDPRHPAETKPRFAWFGLAPRTLADTPYLTLNLHMQQKSIGTRQLVEIAVVLDSKPDATHADVQMRAGFGQRLVKELRAYLMVGHSS